MVLFMTRQRESNLLRTRRALGLLLVNGIFPHNAFLKQFC